MNTKWTYTQLHRLSLKDMLKCKTCTWKQARTCMHTQTKQNKNHVSKQEHTVETTPTSKTHVYANIQMRGAHSNTHTQWGLENCHARWHRHAWRMALSTVLHATERWLVLKPTMIQEGWMSHWKESNARARYLKKQTENKYDRTENV